MTTDIYEITAMSRHDNCYSKFLHGIYDTGCQCKTDTIEIRNIETGELRNVIFPKDRVPFKIGEQHPLEEIMIARTTGVMIEQENKQTKKGSNNDKDKPPLNV